MGALVYPSTSGQGVGALTYSFAAVPGAEYNTTELNASSIYEFRAQEEQQSYRLTHLRLDQKLKDILVHP